MNFRVESFFILVLWMLIPLSLRADSTENRMEGYLGLKGGHSYPIRFNFKIQDNKLSGYTRIYSDPAQYLETRFSGNIDREHKRIIFREEEIVANKGFRTEVFFCLLSGTLSWNEKEKTFGGVVTSRDVSGYACAGGSVVITENKDFNRLWELQSLDTQPAFEQQKHTPSKQQQVSTGKKIVVNREPVSGSPVSVRIPATPDQWPVVLQGQTRKMNWLTDTIVIVVWDHGKVDGDIISVNVPERNFSQELALTSRKDTVRLLFSEKRLMVEFHAINDGNEPPNTAFVQFFDGERIYPVKVQNKKGNIVRFEFMKK